MTEKEKLQIEADLLYEEAGRIMRKIDDAEYFERKKILQGYINKFFKDKTKNNIFYATTGIDEEKSESGFIHLDLKGISFYSDTKLLYLNTIRERNIGTLIEISKEEFLTEYNKVILHYNTLING